MTGPGETVPNLVLLVVAIILQASSSLPLILFKQSAASQKISASLMVLASVIGTVGAVLSLTDPVSHSILLSWNLPFGPAELGIDPLSALFLLPIFIVTGCSALYGAGYWPAHKHPHTVTHLTFFLGLLAASLTTLVMARNSVLFLIAWEMMALGSFFSMTTDDKLEEVRDAGLLYLITTQIGTLALFALFSLLSSASGSFLFPSGASLSGLHPMANAIFFTALIGFGVKAGMMPLHVWLPSAHATAPSHISAIMSGVVLKMGIYGMVRIFSFFADVPLWWGATILVLGMISAVVGVAFALGQHDLKRLLAYHSIENIGIILMGMGIALIGQASGNQTMMILGMAGSLLHVLNHALFKALLFLGAGAVIHATGTREIDLLGGVARRLPLTSTLFLIGAVAICGLPPLNGFVSELMIYLGCFRGAAFSDGAAAALPALTIPALALVGGLAVACFVKVYGIVFLGMPRSEEHSGGHEAAWSMLLPMGILALFCAAIGLAPWLVVPSLAGAVAGWQPSLLHSTASLAGLAPFGWISLLSISLTVCILVGTWLFIRGTSGTGHTIAPTWGCGYLRPTPRMQYTATSFAEMLVKYFRDLLRPRTHSSDVSGIFPAPTRFSSHVPETVLECLYLPFLEYLYRKTAPLRRLQHGRLHLYILYIFVTLVVLLVVTVHS